MLRLPALLAGGTLAGRPRIAVAAAAGTATLRLLCDRRGFRLAFRMPSDAPTKPRRRDDEERASISLGWITHGFLSLKARLARLLTRRSPARAAARRDAGGAERAAPSRASTKAPAPRCSRDSSRRTTTRTKTRGGRAARRASRRPRTAAARKSSGGYVLPPLELLAAPKSDRPRRC